MTIGVSFNALTSPSKFNTIGPPGRLSAINARLIILILSSPVPAPVVPLPGVRPREAFHFWSDSSSWSNWRRPFEWALRAAEFWHRTTLVGMHWQWRDLRKLVQTASSSRLPIATKTSGNASSKRQISHLEPFRFGREQVVILNPFSRVPVRKIGQGSSNDSSFHARTNSRHDVDLGRWWTGTCRIKVLHLRLCYVNNSWSKRMIFVAPYRPALIFQLVSTQLPHELYRHKMLTKIRRRR